MILSYNWQIIEQPISS
jgi:hypothetical protein